jgi:hypothetical protein
MTRARALGGKLGKLPLEALVHNWEPGGARRLAWLPVPAIRARCISVRGG